MLGRRYADDGTALLALNDLQIAMKHQVEEKIRSGHYACETVPCAICGGSELKVIAQKDRYGLRMPVGVCRTCGLVQTNPRMEQAAYDEFYDVEYRSLYSGVAAPTETDFLEQYSRGVAVVDYLKETGILREPDDPFILEVGCGAGGVLKRFKEAGFSRLKGIDLGEAYIDYGRTEHGLDLSVGTLETAELDAKPDLVLYTHSFEHILSPNAELEQIRTVLSERGHLFIWVPGIKPIPHIYSMDLLYYLQNAHVYHYSLKTLSSILSRNGFNVIAGDERVFCLSQVATDMYRPGKINSDYSGVMAYLRRLELQRKYLPMPPQQMKHSLARFLGRVGLLPLARALRAKARGRSRSR